MNPFAMNPADLVGLDAVIITDQLKARPARRPEHAVENRALVALVEQLARAPQDILQKLTDATVDVCRAQSAGLSLLTRDRSRFYWAAISGTWAHHAGGGTPREFGPCGTVLDRNAPCSCRTPNVISRTSQTCSPHRRTMLVPFHVDGEAVGTIWAINHDKGRRFDSEDHRVLTVLSRFASAAYDVVRKLKEIPSDGRPGIVFESPQEGFEVGNHGALE